MSLAPQMPEHCQSEKDVHKSLYVTTFGINPLLRISQKNIIASNSFTFARGHTHEHSSWLKQEKKDLLG